MRLTVMNSLSDEKTITALLDTIESYAREFQRYGVSSVANRPTAVVPGNEYAYLVSNYEEE